MNQLFKSYAPTTLDEVLGQPRVVEALKQYVAAPYSAAMLFFGESGVGKTATALALARGLGVDVTQQVTALGGLHEIAFGCQTADAVRGLEENLAYCPMFGLGWKACIINECDRMQLPAETVWLDLLEHLPGRTVVVFTTNQVEKLSKRFRDRCEAYQLTHDADELREPIQSLCRRVWQSEGFQGDPPDLDTLGMPSLGDPDSMHASFRSALQQVQKLVRAAKAGQLERASAQVKLDAQTASSVKMPCPYCGKTMVVKTGQKTVACPNRKCGKRSAIEAA
jgi:replication-associated recombination protein RarA